MPKKTNKKRRRNDRIRGAVFESKTGRPLGDLIVRVFDEANPAESDFLGQGKTDAKGKFSIRYRKTKAVSAIRAEFPDAGPDLVFGVYEADGTPLRLSDPFSGAARFEPVQIRLRLTERDLLNKAFGVLLENALKQPRVLRRASQMLARKYDLDPDHVYRTLRDADPFGIDPFTWRTTVCCILNNLMDTFKQTPLASQLLFNGGTYQHLWTLPSVRGLVRGPIQTGALVHEGVEGREVVDEDFNFKLEPTLPTFNRIRFQVMQSGRINPAELADLNDPASEYFNRLHCEIIPCDQVGDMRRFIAELKRRARQAEADTAAGRTPQSILIEIAGVLTWDGRHSIWPGHLEVHPVTWARFL